MSTLLLIRHGQASFGAGDYDKLSELGITQSFFLGEYWVERGMKLDAVFSGEQVRQKHTLEIVSDVYRAAGSDFPESGINGAFNEYDATGIMTHLLPKLLKENSELQEIVNKSSGIDTNSPEGRKIFQLAFEIVMDHWIAGKTEVEEVETWAHFKARVLDGIKKIVADFPSGKTVAVFTSGGAISATLQYAIQSPDKVALGLGWVVKNGSVTEFRYNADRFTLTGFNMTPHFYDDVLVTYR